MLGHHSQYRGLIVHNMSLLADVIRDRSASRVSE